MRDTIVVLDMDINFLNQLNVVLPRCPKLSMVLVGLEGINPSLVYPNLVKLNLERNRFQSLPDFTKWTPKLAGLNVAFNILTTFPIVPKETIQVLNVR